ncbi:unnamed protein product [Durusdinium trenchii]|uniref:Uncharacterized protein n=1 Tax=Durusdinium trenchii TaxID=1381693 RepID=A0ABP0LVN3_9DINO
MRLLCLLSFLHGLEASRSLAGMGISLADVQGLFSRQRLSSDQAVVSNRSVTSLDATTSKKKEKHPCSQVVSGAEDRERSHWFGGDCKCPAGYVVAGKSWECKDALGKQKFSSKIGPTKCHCAATSECESMVLGAKQRNSYKKNPDRPCKCEDHDFVLEGKAPQCAVFLGERYFPNTLPPQECYCHRANLVEYDCSEIAHGAVETDKQQKRCICPEGLFLGGEDQQCKDFYGAHIFPKRLKPGLCTCSANARPDHGRGSGKHLAMAVLPLFLLWWI